MLDVSSFGVVAFGLGFDVEIAVFPRVRTNPGDVIPIAPIAANVIVYQLLLKIGSTIAPI